jgi:hypothetical protein
MIEINAIGDNNLGQKTDLSVHRLTVWDYCTGKTAILLTAVAILTALSAVRTTQRPAAV